MNDLAEIQNRENIDPDNPRRLIREASLHRQITREPAPPRACHAHEYSPQWLALAEKATAEQHEIDYWGFVLRELRTSWRNQNDNATPSDKSLAKYQPKHFAMFREATGAIGRVIGKTLRERRKHEETLAALRRQMAEIEGRPSCDETRSNAEGQAILDASRTQKQAAIERDGCCGGEPMHDGFCFGIGPCPRVQEIKQATAFCESYLKWLDDETALAEITARLGSIPFGETNEHCPSDDTTA